ncbi:MAG: hypothetical protein AAFQ90_13465, partial [Pseudomonadota bacterium]
MRVYAPLRNVSISFACLLGLFGTFLPALGRAETLKIAVQEPAPSETLIGSHVIAREFELTGRWAERWAARVTSRFAGAQLFGKPMFDMPVPSDPDRADLVIT